MQLIALPESHITYFNGVMSSRCTHSSARYDISSDNTTLLLVRADNSTADANMRLVRAEEMGQYFTTWKRDIFRPV